MDVLTPSTMLRNRPATLRQLVRQMTELADELRERLERELCGGLDSLELARQSLEEQLEHGISAATCADMLSQAAVCALPIVAVHRAEFEQASNWLMEQASPWQRVVLESVFDATGVGRQAIGPRGEGRWFDDGSILGSRYSVLSTQYSILSTDDDEAKSRNCSDDNRRYFPANSPLLHLYERFLHAHSRQHRKRRGVFYTPPQLVRFIARNVHRQLREEFGLQQGLADSNYVSILDPAAGTGAFLLAAIDVIHETVSSRADWVRYVVEELLPRLHGVEVLPAPCLLAHLHIALKLAETGFDFSLPGRVRVELGNTLAGPRPYDRPPTVILGNPPFSSLSENRGEWISRLVRGSVDEPGYVIAGEERLGERKTWLHDDYVKFLRYAQWEIERSGSGIIGFVTNHGYLDNLTFRLMRRELLRVFPRIDVVDLHGNRKKGETAPGGERDENVFGLDQGVAVTFFRRPPQHQPEAQARENRRHKPEAQAREAAGPSVRHAELWGMRKKKLAALDRLNSELPHMVSLVPTGPKYLFVPAPHRMPAEYAAAWRLPDAMPVSTTAPVTARDHFVIARTREELCRRIEEFRDLSIPDDEIRRRYFTSSRSARYSPGDTRGWKLSEARKMLASEPNWERFIRRCLYRPFDWRFIFWHEGMIDWPRSSVVDRLGEDRGQESGDSAQETRWNNLVLLTRRQMLPTQPCTFFWIADTLPIDGVIRSDNRGSESLFPLYLYGADDRGSSKRQANFAPQFIEQMGRRLSLAWIADGGGDCQRTFGPEDLLHYIYALFHWPTYREKYADELRSDFPRVLVATCPEIFVELVRRGQRLALWHTLQSPPPEIELNLFTEEQLIEFRVGAHQPLRPTRRNRTSRDNLPVMEHPLRPYIAATLQESAAIDRFIWPTAFSPY